MVSAEVDSAGACADHCSRFEPFDIVILIEDITEVSSPYTLAEMPSEVDLGEVLCALRLLRDHRYAADSSTDVRKCLTSFLGGSVPWRMDSARRRGMGF